MSHRDLSILHHFASLHDPRLDRTKKHKLEDLLVIALCATLAGADGFVEIEAFGHSKRAWLQGFLELPNGIPSHDTFNRLFAALNPKAFQDCFAGWMNSICDRLGLKRLAIDGKTLRGSHRGGKGEDCLHLVSVWAVDNGLTLGQEAVEAGSNEITALPKLLRTLDLAGAIVTIDAIGCQKEVAQTIRREGGDYVLAVKENQETLYRDIAACFEEALRGDLRGVRHDLHFTQETGHGRKEERSYCVIYDPAGLSTRCEWQDLRAIVMVGRSRWVEDKYSHEVQYYISSGEYGAAELAKSIRGHWGIENNLHWILDVVFREDESQVKDRNAAENLAMLRRVAVSLLKQDESKGSLKGKRKRAGWNDEFLAHLLGLLSAD